MMLEGTQTPTVDSELTNINYSISHDNGLSWSRIQKKEETGVSGLVSIPEILNYNNSHVNAIKTKTPVTSVRLKIALEREDGNFKEGISALSQKTVSTGEIQGVPVSAPFTIQLNHPPVTNSVVLVDPLFGSRGIKESSYYIKYNQNQSEDTFIGLPFRHIKVPVEKNDANKIVLQEASSWLYVYVGGERWHQRTKAWEDYKSGLDENGDPFDPNLNIFDFNPVTGELSFSPDSSYAVEQPPENAPISMHFGAERLFPSSQPNDHIAGLDYPTSNSKEDFTILRYEKLSEDGSETIRSGASKHVLEKKNIEDFLVTNNSSWSPIDFINGKDELDKTANEYSLDKENGIVYFSKPAGKMEKVAYNYRNIHELSTDDWEWSGEGLLRQAISIKDSGWAEIDAPTDNVTLDNANKINLGHLAIVKGSLNLLTTTSADPFFREVAYMNGRLEFANATPDARQYSVDYENGEIYLSEEYSGQVDYEYSYTNYQAKYRIARKVNPDHYTVNTPSKQIAIKDSEFFKYLETPNTTQSGKAAYYLVNYDYVSETREDVEELKDYFTPVVKDYILKILKKGTLF